MSLQHTMTEKFALSMLARDGIGVIWRLNVAAADAYQAGHPRAADALLEVADAAENAWLRAEGGRELILS